MLTRLGLLQEFRITCLPCPCSVGIRWWHRACHSLALLSEGVGWAWQPRSFGRLDLRCHHRCPVVPAGSSPRVCLSAVLPVPWLLNFAGCHRAAPASHARPSQEQRAGKGPATSLGSPGRPQEPLQRQSRGFFGGACSYSPTHPAFHLSRMAPGLVRLGAVRAGSHPCPPLPAHPGTLGPDLGSSFPARMLAAATPCSNRLSVVTCLVGAGPLPRWSHANGLQWWQAFALSCVGGLGPRATAYKAAACCSTCLRVCPL